MRAGQDPFGDAMARFGARQVSTGDAGAGASEKTARRGKVVITV
jgi:hypothetical protein